jgi:putative transcriptional regulator
VSVTSIGSRLKRLRSAAGLTQAALAERAGVPLQTLRNWECDRREPLLGMAAKLARALGVPINALVEDNGDAARARPAKRKRGK